MPKWKADSPFYDADGNATNTLNNDNAASDGTESDGTASNGATSGGTASDKAINGEELTPEEAEELAEKIAPGHARKKHAADFGDMTDKEFKDEIADIILQPDDEYSNGKKAIYWDASTGTIVVVNPGDVDGGSAFKPDRGKGYFDDEKGNM